MITLTINGKSKELEGPTNLISYLDTMNVNKRFIAVAYNGTVMKRDELEDITLMDGDEVEIVRAVGGG
jgi:sulfur carrier protein